MSDPEPLLLSGADPDLAPPPPIRPTRGERRTWRVALAAIALAHLAGLALAIWVERALPPQEAPAIAEIPVEIATPEEARAAGADSGAPAGMPERKPTPAPAEARAQPPQQGGSAPDNGGIFERPSETDLPQKARTRGGDKTGEDKPAPKSGEPNPFGGLAALEPPRPKERAPVFIAPQDYLEQTRPTPAPDPTNDNYRAKVLGKVAASMIDPDRPRPRALAIVGFRVDEAGALASAWLVRPSGHADLDAEALEMVRRAAPFARPPAGAEREFAAAIAFGPQD